LPAAGSQNGLNKTRDNTNLEDISDWLTKIIVGLGLANFHSFLSYFDRFGKYISVIVAPAQPDGAAAYVVAIASVLYGFACGFVFFYVWARGTLARVLNELPKL
jgi:hypothetical protein